jgi:DNA-binding phage protein
MKVMPLTHDFKETIRARAQRDAKFRQALLREAVESYLNGDLETGKAVLRDYVNATLGFQELEERTDIPAKSLMRMLGPKGSPSAANLSSILTALQKTEGVHFELSLRR